MSVVDEQTSEIKDRSDAGQQVQARRGVAAEQAASGPPDGCCGAAGDDAAAVRERVRKHYAAAAEQVSRGAGGGCRGCGDDGLTEYAGDADARLARSQAAEGEGAERAAGSGAAREGMAAEGMAGSGVAREGMATEGTAGSGTATGDMGVEEAAGRGGVLTDCGSGAYSVHERESLPAQAVHASLGCGNPLQVAELRAGETVLDLGSGGGIDTLLSGRRVGPSGKVYGLDMTDEMLSLARANAARAGAANVEFLKGHIEAVPLPADTVDVIISNCVINLSVDKPAVFAEAFRVLRPGGRLGVSDIVADDGLTPARRAARGSYVGCIAGALSFMEYRDGLAAVGFTDIEITPTHEVTDGMHAAIIRAAKPGAPRQPRAASSP